MPFGDGYTLTATPPTADSEVSEPRTFDVPEGTEPITDQDFVVTFPTPPATGSLSGTAFEQGGGRLAGIPIEIAGPGDTTYATVTDADGNWQLDGLPPGSYTATVRPATGMTVVGDDTQQRDIPDAGGDITDLNFELALPPVETFTAGGTVTTADGDPVSGVDVEVVDPVTEQTPTETTDDTGTWSIEDLSPAENYTAEITVPEGYDPVGASTLTFDVEDENVTGLDFELEPEAASPTPSVSPTPTTPTPTPTTSTPEPTPAVTDDPNDDGSNDGDSASNSSTNLASTGGPSLLIGAGGLALVLAGLLSVAHGIRRRRS